MSSEAFRSTPHSAARRTALSQGCSYHCTLLPQSSMVPHGFQVQSSLVFSTKLLALNTLSILTCSYTPPSSSVNFRAQHSTRANHTNPLPPTYLPCLPLSLAFSPHLSISLCKRHNLHCILVAGCRRGKWVGVSGWQQWWLASEAGQGKDRMVSFRANTSEGSHYPAVTNVHGRMVARCLQIL